MTYRHINLLPRKETLLLKAKALYFIEVNSSLEVEGEKKSLPDHFLSQRIKIYVLERKIFNNLSNQNALKLNAVISIKKAKCKFLLLGLKVS